MATPDYDPNVITPPPGPGSVNDLAGDPTTTGSSGSGGAGGTGAGGTPLFPGSQPTPPPASDPYTPRDVPVPTVDDFELKEVPYKPPPLPDMPAVDKTMTAAPKKTLEPMSNLIPGGDTTSINEDWEAIAAKAPGVTAEQTVQGQLEKLFAEGSPLLDYARGLGLQYANSRGLINSDIAGEAGAMALYNQAVPIATADAEIFARRAEQEAAFWQNAGLQAQQANFQSRLQAQAHVENMRQQALQGDINARLQLQQFGYNWDLNEQQNIHRMELAAFEGKVQAKLNLQQLGLDVERLRVDWGYRVQANDQELRNALIQSKFEDDQLVERITQQHMNNLNEIERQAYENRLRDYENNQAAWDRQQSEQDWRSGENAADRQSRADELARADTNAWMSQYTNSVDRLGTNLTNEIMTIMNNGNMTASQQQYAARQAWDRYVRNFQNTTEIYKGSSLWDPNYGTPAMMDFGDVYTGGGTPGGGGSQPSTPANPDGITGGSSDGSLDDQPISFRNQWESSGYDLTRSGNYWTARSPSGRMVVWHEQTQQWVDPNHHQYRNDFPGLNIGGSGSGGSTTIPGDDNNNGQLDAWENTPGGDAGGATGYTSSLYAQQTVSNPLYSSNRLTSNSLFNYR